MYIKEERIIPMNLCNVPNITNNISDRKNLSR
jgi:hypothetical protein